MEAIFVFAIIAMGLYIWADRRRQQIQSAELELRDRDRKNVLVARALTLYPTHSSLDSVSELRRDIYHDICMAQKKGSDVNGLAHDLVLLLNEEHRLSEEQREESFRIVGDAPVVPNVYEQQRMTANE